MLTAGVNPTTWLSLLAVSHATISWLLRVSAAGRDSTTCDREPAAEMGQWVWSKLACFHGTLVPSCVCVWVFIFKYLVYERR